MVRIPSRSLWLSVTDVWAFPGYDGTDLLNVERALLRTVLGAV